MRDSKAWLLYLIPLLITACSNTEKPRYQDTSHLEKPPIIIIAESPKKTELKKEDLAEKTGLGGVASISNSKTQPVLKIKKIFDRSWDIVEQALSLSEIKITDKNRDKGVFFVNFDPDQKESSFFSFDDEYEEAAYKLIVKWRDSDTEVTAELVDQDGDDILDDGEDDIDDSTDSGSKLIKALYKTIRDDLPID